MLSRKSKAVAKRTHAAVRWMIESSSPRLCSGCVHGVLKWKWQLTVHVYSSMPEYPHLATIIKLLKYTLQLLLICFTLCASQIHFISFYCANMLFNFNIFISSSALWYSWLGTRNSIWPIRISDAAELLSQIFCLMNSD